MTMKSRIIVVIVGAVALLFSNTTQAQNGVEPRYERYNADRKSIEVDGDLSDWAGVSFIEPRFEASDGRETGKGNSTIGDVTYSTFAEYAGGTWSGPDDHTTLIAVAWDQNGLYLGIVVTDDEHEHAAGNAWNGDGVQMGLTNADRSTVTHLYNYCIKDGYESGKVYKNGDAGIIADKERGPGNYSVAMVRDDAKKTTIYEALFTPDSFGFAKFEVGQQFGFGVCVNDGDKDTPGQKGWSGWGPHMIVFGKTAPDAALVTLTSAEVLASFETDFSAGEIPETAELFGTATIGPDELDESDEPNEFLHVTDAVNSQNGSMKIQDITDGRTFKEFEVGFRLYISDSTCCGSADDTSPAHRPADGWSLSIGNELPDTVGLAEEGTGSGIRICFDTWDSGGGEAPAIDVWNGVEGEVGDGSQDTWSGGLFVRQKFDGVGAAQEDEKFTDPDTGEFVFMWTHGEWVDFSLKVYAGRIVINYKGYEMINEELPAGWPALTAPQWLFAGRTGGANSAHWVDDFYVKVFKPSGPIISAFEGTAGGFSVSLVDAEGNGLEVDSVKAKFDGADVAVTKSKSDEETTIAYSTDSPLSSGSDHTIELTYSDEKGSVHVKTLSFSVPNYIVLNADSIVSDSIKGESGFIANITQISTEQTGKDSLHGNSTAKAEKQLNGEYIDPDYEEPWLNEADIEAEEGWSYYPVWVEWVNQNQDAPAAAGNFSSNNGYEDEYIPGIPGWYDSTDGIVGEYLALLQLDVGAYTLGVNSDDGFKATVGANFNDIWSQEIAGFDGGRGASDTIIDIFVDKAGLYPFRVLWYEGGGGANIEIFSMVDGEKVLINDPDVEGSIKAYTPKGATVDESITQRDASTGRAAVVSVTPTPGQKRVESASSIEVVIENGSATTVNQSSVKMILNGQEVAVDVSRSGDIVTISHTPDGGLAAEANTAIVSFKESNGNERSSEWSFDVKVTKPADATGLASGLIAHWPLDEIQDETTSDVVGGYDMDMTNIDDSNVVEGKYGNAISFSNADQTLLWRKNDEGDDLPANQHDSFTVSFWSKVNGTGQNDLRLFSESNTQGNNTPLFNIGTRNNGSDGTIDIYIRGIGGGPTVGHIFSTAEPFDDEWHHVVFVQEDLERSIYVDGVLDDLEIGPKAEGDSNVDATTIGGILRGSASHWVTGLIDEVAIWKRALSAAEVASLTSDGIPTSAGITWDFNDGLPEESEVAGSAEHSEDEGVDDSGALVLTRNLASQIGGWLSPEIGTVSSFTIDFDIYIADGTATQADGISMAISDDLEPVEPFGEEGIGSKLIVCFDNWDNGGGEAPAIDIIWAGERIATQAMGAQGASTLDTDGWWPVHIELTTGGDLTLLYDDELIHDAVNIADFAPIENARVAFGGRTGGANANQFIDNFRIVFDATEVISPFDAAVLADSPVHWYKFDEPEGSTTLVDHGSGGVDGEYIGVEPGQEGATGAGEAAFFPADPDINDLVSFGEGTTITEEWSAEFIVNKGNDTTSQALINGPNTSIRLRAWGNSVAGVTQYGVADYLFEGAVAPVEEWAHIVFVTSEGATKYYQNGALLAEGAFAVDLQMVTLSRDTTNENAHDKLTGLLDEVVVYDVALTEEQVASHFAATGLVGPVALVDISQPGDPVVASSDNSPGGEQAPNAIDDNPSLKYLNFDGANNEPSGLTITTGGGVVVGLSLTSANDAPDRDPATFVLSGSNDGGATFDEIASGDVPSFGARFERQEVSFENEESYTTYELIFPTTVGPSTCCMQIAEIELLGTPGPAAPAPPELPWSVGRDDNGWPAGDGGGPSTTFVQESGTNELPGNPASPEVAQQADDDYYWAGVYSTVIAGNGDYEPVGLVEVNEESAERAWAGTDNDLRYHFNLPESLQPTDRLIVSYDALNLHTDGQTDPRYGVEVYVNSVQVQSEIVIRPDQLGQTYDTEPFTLADVNAEVGSGYDNIITLKGVNYNAEGGGNWMGLDYVQLSQAAPEPDPSGLIAHFPLDSDGNSSDGGFTASTVTDVTFGTAGANANTGTSATFNGSSSIIQHDWSAGLNPEGSFTLALWARSDGGAGAWHSPVTSRNDKNPDSQGYLIYDNSPSGVWTFWSGNGTVDGNWQALDGPAVDLGEWEHVAIVYDSTAEMKQLYVNGELAVEANDVVAPNDTKPWNIGAGGDTGTAYFFNGDIDDIGLWNRALSPEDIQVVMEQGVTGLGGGDAVPEVTYEAPEGGWAYSVDVGDITTWNHDNGSDQWDGSAIGGEFGDDNRPGGVSLLDGYVRLQDTGDPRDYGYSDSGSNRKIYLGQSISDKGGSDTILNDGATIHFIARIPTDGPLDPLHVDGGGGVEDYPAGGDGYENHDGGKGNIGIKQGAGGNISFSLSEAGKVIITEDGTEFDLSTTEWHEFWVTIEQSDGGHTVSVYLDGSTEANVFTVTAGGGSDFGGSYLAMGVGSTGRSGALDVAAFDFSPGAIAPDGAGGAAPTLSIVNNGDGTVTVTFEGKLQAAPTVNGPWADVEGATSPQIIPASEAMQYGRAVSE